MPEPMTLEESVAFFDGEKTDATGKLREWERAVAGLLAHGRRTIAARSGEPRAVTYWRDCVGGFSSDLTTTVQITPFAIKEMLAYIDTLTAELAAARQEFAEWLDASRKALDAHAEVVAERDRLAAMVERQKPVLDAAHDVVGWQGTQREEQAWATLRDSLSAMEGSDV